MLGGVQAYLRVIYLIAVIGMSVLGILMLALQNWRAVIWQKCKMLLSLTLGTVLVLLFMVSSQPYAAVFSFSLLAIKVLLLIKYQ